MFRKRKDELQPAGFIISEKEEKVKVKHLYYLEDGRQFYTKDFGEAMIECIRLNEMAQLFSPEFTYAVRQVYQHSRTHQKALQEL